MEAWQCHHSLSTSGQNVENIHLIRLSSRLLTKKFWCVICAFITLMSPELNCYIYCTEYLWGWKIKIPSIQRCVGFQEVLSWGWNECQTRIWECFGGKETLSLLFLYCKDSRRGKIRVCSGVLLEAGSLCEAGRRIKRSEHGTGGTAVLSLEMEGWEARLNMKKGLWTCSGEPEININLQTE